LLVIMHEEMRRKRERISRGREAPIIVTPWALVRLIKQTAEVIRLRRSKGRSSTKRP
jgi:hypothetical protein